MMGLTMDDEVIARPSAISPFLKLDDGNVEMFTVIAFIIIRAVRQRAASANIRYHTRRNCAASVDDLEARRQHSPAAAGCCLRPQEDAGAS
jgi:hypothetical protein